MPGCKPGDLAEFLPGHKNEGRRVLINEQIGKRSEGVVFNVTPLQPLYAHSRHKGWWLVVDMRKAPCCDSVLRPIRPPKPPRAKIAHKDKETDVYV